MNEPFRILLVEDNAGDVFLLETALEQAEVNCDFIVLSDGGRAVEFFRRQGNESAGSLPDLVILDSRLPSLDGLDVLKAMRMNPLYADVPVAVTSSSLHPKERKQFEGIGVFRYFEKPSDLAGYFRMGVALGQILVQNRRLAAAATTC